MRDLLVTDGPCVQSGDECHWPVRCNPNEPLQSAAGFVKRRHLTLEERGRWALTPQLNAVNDDCSVRAVLEDCG